MFNFKMQAAFFLSGLLLAFNSQANFTLNEVYEVGGDTAPDAEIVDDINGDGFDDIITSVDSKLMILFGSETGKIKNKYTLRQPYPIISMITGDFNGDGEIDLAMHRQGYYYSSSQVIIYLNQGTTLFELVKSDGFSAYKNTSLQSTDYNEDGFTDIAMGRRLYLNDGTANFDLTNIDYENDFSEDINGDGIPDQINQWGSIQCGNEDGSFTPCARVKVNNYVQTTADLNENPGMEILSWIPVTTSQQEYTYTVNYCGRSRGYRKRSGTRYVIRGNRYRRTRNCSWKTTRTRTVIDSTAVIISSVALDGSVTEQTSGAVNGIINDIQIGDFNADTFQDLLVSSSDGSNYLFSGLENGTFGLPVLITATGKRGNLITGDWNNDGAGDLAWFVSAVKQDTVLYTVLGVVPSSEATLPENPTPVVEPDPTLTPEPAPTTPSNNFPAIDGDAEPIETDGIISEAGTNFFIVNGTTIWYDSSATIKFETGYGNTVDAGDEVQVEAYTNIDGSGTAIKFQIGPL